ncbi:MAG TPA: enoyl-CoA hydratase-related protein [Acidimicrobiia bacterium]|nr:enoyl-CoA hydratase-related protein [Acidimicrobiia bacterium]
MNPAEFTELRYEVEAGVALVTLNRPDRRNAWSGPMAVEWRWALHHADTDPAVRVVVLAGAGEHFCVGADTGSLSRLADAGGVYDHPAAVAPPWGDDVPAGLRHNHAAALTVSTPVIAALHGACAGAGVVVVTYADLRFAARGARIATSFARLGLPAEYGIGWVLPRLMGTANAAQFLYSGGPIDAEEAQRLGFVQRVIPDEELLSDTLDYARRLARESSAESLRTMKRALLIDAAGDFDTAYRRSVGDMNAALRHRDLKEGLAAFKDRRPPNFLGPQGRPVHGGDPGAVRPASS